MTLREFSDLQEKTVRHRAAMLQLKPAFDAERAAKREIETIHELRAVSVNELLAEVLLPGSFSNQ